MFRQSKTLEIALCSLVLMVVVGFGFQAVNADDDKETMIQLERIAQQSDQSQSNHDSSFPLVYANTPGGITYYDDKLWVVIHLVKESMRIPQTARMILMLHFR